MLSARTRLSVMMFLQYFVWGSWAVSAGGYMGKVLQFSGQSIGLIYSTTAIGAIFAPLFVGYVADRLFATERILATLHIVGGAIVGGSLVSEGSNTGYFLSWLAMRCATCRP